MQAAGLDLSLNLPNTKLDLGSMPKVSANLNLVDNDVYVAIVVPIMLAGLAVPFVVMRAVMMELDCFVAHKKDVDSGRTDRHTYRYTIQELNALRFHMYTLKMLKESMIWDIGLVRTRQ